MQTQATTNTHRNTDIYKHLTHMDTRTDVRKQEYWYTKTIEPDSDTQVLIYTDTGIHRQRDI